jgi:spermidine synthase
MPDNTAPAEHVRPFVYDDRNTKSLHFSICELQSRMRLDRPDALDVEYTRAMMGFLLFNGQPGSIAMIGLGGGSLAKFCHRHLPETRVTVVEINPHVVALRDEFHVPRDDRRFRVVEGDGADFVRHAPQRFDVLLVDGFDYSGQPTRLSTQRFYDDCYQALAPDGMMVVNLHADHPELGLFIGRIERSFGANLFTVRVKREGNVIVFASRAPLVARQPHALGKEAWSQLRATFTQVLASKGDGMPD